MLVLWPPPRIAKGTELNALSVLTIAMTSSDDVGLAIQVGRILVPRYA
jgi:hypothetical protein